MKHSFLLLASAAAACAFLNPSRADACGGCFVPQTERTVVTDHRMALSVSPTQTVLWDQIKYSGDPAEFAWVLPVRAGAKLQVSNDEWFTALDASTQPVVYQPNTYGGGLGCALTGCGSDDSATSSAEGANGGQVQVLSQQVVGPYETVTLRATDKDALTNWLRSHAYDIPTTIEPTIKAYVDEAFDFIALRLRPDCGERSMQPVRVVTQGADPTLPLRMVAAGVGARVGITLYIISEGRWQTQNFRHAEFDESRLLWDRVNGRSNYDDVSQDLMGQDSGRTWLTEYANRPQLPATSVSRYSNGQNPGLTDTYLGLCRSIRSSYGPSPTGAYDAGNGGSFTPCPRSTADAGISQQQEQQPEDAGADAATDSGTDAGHFVPASSGEYTGDLRSPYAECAYLDDLMVAMNGLHRDDVWVTRLRAVLPSDALSTGDLRLEPAAVQTTVNNVHYATHYSDEDSKSSKGSCLSSPTEHRAFGSWAFGASAAIVLVAWARRRRAR